MTIHRKAVFILIISVLFSTPLFTMKNAQAAVGKWEIFELSLTTTNSYTNKYTDVTLTATFTAPSTKTIVMPGFWDGGQTWKVRMAPNEIGTWSYITSSNDSQLNNQSNQFDCIASNKKGFIQVNPSDPYKFQYADGTPFFWMGDTCWHLFCDDIDYDTDFKDFIDRRASQHFTHIHAGLACGDAYENEGGKPFPTTNLDNLNPSYFTYVDRKVEYITSKGMVMGLFLTWAQQFVDFTTDQFERYEKYVIARYAAYNVYWVVSGEYDEAGDAYDDEFIYHGNKIDEFDPYDHPISIHTTSTNNEFGTKSWLTYIMHQKFEQDNRIMLSDLLDQLGRTDVTIVKDVWTSIADGDHLYDEIQIDRIFNKPVVNAEFGYEQYDGWTGRDNRTTPDTVRRLAWNMVMAGGFITYGMEATYKAFDGGSFSWKLPDQELGGSDYMKLLYEFFAGTRWWEMNPDNSVITSGPIGHAIALINPGIEYVIYLRSGSSVSVDLSDVSGNLKVKWFDTKDGDTYYQGRVPGGGEGVFAKPADIDGDGVLYLYEPGDELNIDFGGVGLYGYDGRIWIRPTPSNPQYLSTYDNKLAVDFGSAGLWEFDGNSWTKLTPSDADNTGNCMVAYGTGLVIDFGSLGLWEYDSSTWSKLTPSDAQHLAVYGNKLVGDFGSAGLWEFDGTSWSKLTPSDADNTGNCMVAYGTGLVIDFGGLGLWQYDASSWTKLTPSDAEHLCVYGSKLVGDFGSAGLWEFDGNSWTKLTPADADNTGNCMVAYGTGLVVDFGGFGIYQYDGGVWTWLTPSDAQYLATYGSKLVGDFGSVGLWEFNGSSWAKLTPANADNTGNCMVTVDFQ